MADEKAEQPDSASQEGFSGMERTAIFLMSIGEAEAAEVLRHMGPKEVQTIGEAIAQLTNVEKKSATHIIKTFNSAVGGQTALGMGFHLYQH